MTQIQAKFPGKCKLCLTAITPGDQIWYNGPFQAYCLECGSKVGSTPDHAPAVPAPVAKAASLTAKGKPKIGGGKKKPTIGAPYKSITQIPNPGKEPVTLRTQKAKGIRALQEAGMLSKAYARIAQTEDQIVESAKAIGLPCFVRPCPVTPRHGFVDSRQVETEADVIQTWKEAIEADPEAEAIAMPFIDSSHNMVWRPGMLSIGPGHDGATAGVNSISVYLQPEYSGSWHNLAEKAGVNTATADPFIEAVAGDDIDLVLTQIRGGVKGAPTASDWIPVGMTVARVIPIDPETKNEPGKMLAWETECKGLTPGADIVWNPGGNLGDHWSVHAQLNGIAVVTTFKPTIGQTLEPCGEALVELEPQAIVFGFLGGLLSPSLKLPVNRKRAVCASVMGTHHGIRMGGDAGAFLGASVAFMLRLGQAAIWGEARHAKSIGLNRDQIYTKILDDWATGRKELADKIKLFYTHKWGGGFGGQAWAACGQATVALDRSMIDLVRMPSGVNAKRVLAELTNAVNCAHNNGWWLNKFCEASWFDLAAELDPRVALMAGPLWYQSTMAPMDDRMKLLDLIEGMDPVDLGKWNGDVPKGKQAKAPKATAHTSADELPDHVSMAGAGHGVGHYTPKPPKPSKKQGELSADLGGMIQIPQIPIGAQIKSGTGHMQITINAEGGYWGLDFSAGLGVIETAAIESMPDTKSAGGTGTPYKLLLIEQTGPKAYQIKAGAIVLLTVTVG